MEKIDKSRFIDQQMLDNAINIVGSRIDFLTKYFHIHPTTFWKNIKNNNLDFIYQKPGSQLHNLSQEEFNLIMTKHGSTLKDIALYFNISYERVRQICILRNLKRLSRTKIVKVKVQPKLQHRKSDSNGGNKIYQIYHNIKAKCYNSTNYQYHNNGARGSEMSTEFYDNFIAFADYLVYELGYNEAKEKDPTICLTKIDPNKPYEKGNLKFCSLKELTQRKRQHYIRKVPSKKYHYMGYYGTMKELGQLTGRPRSTIWSSIMYKKKKGTNNVDSSK